MITVTVCGATYSCVTAIKGSDYIRLLDEAGERVASFESIADFSIFAIAGGSWTTPKGVGDCPIAVVREDGTISKCTKTTGQLLTAGEAFNGQIVLKNGIQYGTEVPSTGVEGQLFFKI